MFLRRYIAVLLRFIAVLLRYIAVLLRYIAERLYNTIYTTQTLHKK